MEIRTAVKSDAKDLLEIFNYEVQNNTATFAITTQTLEERTKWLEEHIKDNHPLIVAKEGEQTAGYASLSEFRSNEAYRQTVELSVYVDHRYRGRGVGELLMQELLKMARENSEIHVVIAVITAGNEASVRLHEKMGFAYCGTFREVGRKFGRWLDTVNYQLTV